MLVGRIYRQAAETPEKLAIVADNRALSYAEFARLIAATRRYLAIHALAEGSVAVIPTGTQLNAWLLVLALRSLGVTTLACHPARLGSIDMGEAENIVVIPQEHSPQVLARIAASGPRLISVPIGMYADAPAITLVDRPDPEARFAGHILLTSGTTGAYKKVLLPPARQPAAWETRRRLFAIGGGAVVNIFHLGCWTAGGHNFPVATWDAGGTVVCCQHRKPWVSLRVPGTTHAIVSPHLLTTLLRAPECELVRDDQRRLILTGGALPQPLADAAKARLTRNIFTYVGATEAGAYTLTRIESTEDLRWHCVLRSRRVEIVDKSGISVPTGTLGLVRVDLSTDVTRYCDDEAASRAFFRDGWFYPGDLGVLRADGRLALHGRATEIISILGCKIASGPIEAAVANALGIAGVCVFSAQNAAAEEEICVALETASPVDQQRLTALLRRELAGAAGCRVHFLAEFPRNAMGKIRRHDLQRLLLGPPTA